MKQLILLIGLVIFLLGCADNQTTPEVKSLLVEPLKNSHSQQNWFVPTKIAIDGLTAEQSNWKDSTDNHSIGELVSHLVFWSEMNLRAFKGEDLGDLEVDNKETFKTYTHQEWQDLVHRLDSIQSEWLVVTEKATDQQLTEWSSEIANMAAHSAYHAGQIIYIRKRNGWWKKK